jgi:ribosomal protein L31
LGFYTTTLAQLHPVGVSIAWSCVAVEEREEPEVNHCDFHYSHLLPKKPGILPLEETMTKKCRRCGAEFVTRSRIRKRCDICQTVVSAEKQKKANERLKARRAARRMCLLKAS